MTSQDRRSGKYVNLLPREWAWLAKHGGGDSLAGIRRLVEAAMANDANDRARQALQDRRQHAAAERALDRKDMDTW